MICSTLYLRLLAISDLHFLQILSQHLDQFWGFGQNCADLREANRKDVALKVIEFALFLLDKAFFDGTIMPDGKL